MILSNFSVPVSVARVRSISFLFVVILSLLAADLAWAGRKPPRGGGRRIEPPARTEPGGLPPCLENGNSEPLPVMNDAVLEWKRTTANQTLKRGRISGVLVKVVQSRASHEHLEVKIGPQDDDSIELVYNQEFGRMPTFAAGAQVDACGDYITANASTGRYPPSPMGAILHWIHFNPGDRDGGRHEHGYIMVDGVLYGHLYN